jgi:alpha-L-rhamnosidase
MTRQRARFALLFRGFLVLIVTLAFAGTGPLPAVASSSLLRVDGLTANGRTDPVGIGGEAPSLGWRLASAERAATQSAYEIRVGRKAGSSDVWSSGKMTSARQVDVAYEGPGLQPVLLERPRLERQGSGRSVECGRVLRDRSADSR